MPTGDRAEFVLQSVRYFQRQDYPDRELVIMDDGADDLQERLPPDERIVYVRVPRGESTGAKRNLACERASGEFLAQWDDDDWYGESRLSTQLAPLLNGEADITGLGKPIFFDIHTWRFWDTTPERHRAMFDDGVHNGTLTFRRDVLERFARYPDLSRDEDYRFQQDVLERGARLKPLICDPPVFVYIRHGENIWPVRSLGDDGGKGWIGVDGPTLPAEDREFYRSYRLRRPRAGRPDRPLLDVTDAEVSKCH